MSEDSNIWEKFKNEDDYALSCIYHQNINFLFGCGKKFSTDEDFIFDIIQDLFYDLIRNRKNLGKTDNIRLYLMISFRRRIIQELEKKQKLAELNNDYRMEPEIVFSAEEVWIKNEEERKQADMVRGKMQELNPKQREALYYKYSLGFDYSQICEIMSITYDSARQLVSRAISSLKKSLVKNTLILTFILKK